jgi:hypothetical protein
MSPELYAALNEATAAHRRSPAARREEASLEPGPSPADPEASPPTTLDITEEDLRRAIKVLDDANVPLGERFVHDARTNTWYPYDPGRGPAG